MNTEAVYFMLEANLFNLSEYHIDILLKNSMIKSICKEIKREYFKYHKNCKGVNENFLLGCMYYIKNQYDIMEMHFQKVINLHDNVKFNFSCCMSKIFMCQFNIKNKNYNEGVKYLYLALDEIIDNNTEIYFNFKDCNCKYQNILKYAYEIINIVMLYDHDIITKYYDKITKYNNYFLTLYFYGISYILGQYHMDNFEYDKAIKLLSNAIDNELFYEHNDISICTIDHVYSLICCFVAIGNFENAKVYLKYTYLPDLKQSS